MEEVTLLQMLDARERRAERQTQLLHQFGRPLVCFTMNIAGPVKYTPLISRSFREGCAALETRLPPILHRESEETVTGCQAMYVVDGGALAIKAVCTAIEEETPLGRLFDMDVLDTEGHKLERQPSNRSSRGCIVCGAPGRGCASRRLHSVEDLQKATRTIMADHFARLDAARTAGLAVQCLLDEVNTTPKPGLVDRRNTGSHRDMDLSAFTASALALEPYFRCCVQTGMDTASLPPEETFSRLRQAGLEAEQTMYRATGGVNTHKGAIFTLGLLCGAVGRLWMPEKPFRDTDALLRETAKLAENALSDFRGVPTTAGERLYRERGLTGIRGETAAGLPGAARWGLPAFRENLAKGLSPNDAGAIALLHLIAQVEDTNLYRRGGPEGAAWARAAARSLLPSPTPARLEALDDAFIARNLSPGGCADLLAVTYFLHSLEG